MVSELYKSLLVGSSIYVNPPLRIVFANRLNRKQIDDEIDSIRVEYIYSR